ncbi:MAG: hypothetical protein AUH78_21830 [Gemmatimonadetes bacterium 13_1_40CM_4_69_8]|nr:MAG: hypothetical protein AUH45_02960 [Gemmatimonadetes bacterium 13_1_40CM_69_22]OLC70174.1 MAG: hypothetical protein AUH78_21830 [Gemmatimonadetes bacterium 13_1_40CM_4_69_8]
MGSTALERAAVACRWRVGHVAAAAEIESDLEAAELVAAVERALAELPPRRAVVCRLRLIDGLSYAQIAPTGSASARRPWRRNSRAA